MEYRKCHTSVKCISCKRQIFNYYNFKKFVRKRAPGGTPDASAAPGARGASATPGAFAAPGARGALAALGEPIRTQIITSWLKINKNGDKIDGVRYTPNNDGMGVDSVTFTGSKLPEMPPAPDLSTVRYGEPINLFNGKDLTGWSLTDEKSTNPFSAVNGELVATIVRTPVPAAAAPGAPPAGGTQTTSSSGSKNTIWQYKN